MTSSTPGVGGSPSSPASSWSSSGCGSAARWTRHRRSGAARDEGNLAKDPLAETLKHHWRAVLVAVGAKVVETAPFYSFATFVVSYATGTLGYANSTALNSVSVAALIATIMIPVMGRLSDITGRRPLYLTGAALLGLFAVPYFLLLQVGATWAIFTASILALGIFWTPVTATLGTLTSEVFSTEVRYTGITLGYQIGAAVAGGTAPLLATYLLSEFDESWVPIAVYIIFTALVSVVAVASAGRILVTCDDTLTGHNLREQ